MWEAATITDAGSNLLAGWIAGTTLRITRAAAGTGTVPDADLYSMTELVQQKQSMSVVDIIREEDGKGVTVKLQLQAAADAYTLQQIAVFARLDDGEEALLAVFQDHTGIAIPAASTSQSFIYNFFGTIAINNTGTLTIEINGGAAVTLETLRRYLAEKENKIDAIGLLYREANGTIRAATGDDFDLSGGGGCIYGRCVTPGATAAKAVTVEDYDSLEIGDLIVVVFEHANTAATPTLKVGDADAKKIVSRGKTSLQAEDYWEDGDHCLLLYDGTNWVMLFRFGTYIPTKQKGVAGGVATLAADGKVEPSQLRGGFVVQAAQPADTSLLWIDNKQIMHYYDTSSKTWKVVLPVWG